MYTTLEHLENHIQKEKNKFSFSKFLGEIKVLILIFVFSFVWILLFTNAQLFFSFDQNNEILDWNQENLVENNTISSVIQENQEKIENIEKMVNEYWEKNNVVQKTTAPVLENNLKNEIKNYDFDFNLLPPTNRLIIPKISLDVPLVDSKYKDKNDFTQWNFNEELENWVVKYPTTPEPGNDWNTLIFGHTSQEWREKNPYGTVFSKIPDLEDWDQIQVIWEWKLYEYQVVEKIVVSPKNVNQHYKKYQNFWKDFITLMGCYPLWRTDKRMMITSKIVNN